MSLQQFLQRLLAEAVELPDLEEWLEAATLAATGSLSAEDAAALVREDRDARS